MQVLLVGVLCATASFVAGGHLAAWPQSAVSVFRSTAPLTQGFAYSSTQYINSLPLTYSFGIRPQLTYQVPQTISAVSPLQAYYPFAAPTYFPSAGAVYYPTTSPIIPQRPMESTQGFVSPTSPTGNFDFNSDSAVIDSAQFPEQMSSPASETNSDTPAASESPAPSPQPSPQFPPAGAPILPSYPQFPQDSMPGFPSFPQFPGGSIPNLPSIPQLPNNPLFPQSPSPSPPSFPSADGQDKGLNDEDTVSIESA